MMTARKYEYIITSERAYRRNDEYRNTLHSDRELKVGDVITLDGLDWTVDEVVTKKEWWVSYYLQDGTQCGGTYMAKDDDELEAILEKEHGDMYGGIADYGCYDDLD